MRSFDPALENLMKFTPTDSNREVPVSRYTAHKSWFEVNKIANRSKRINKDKIAKA